MKISLLLFFAILALQSYAVLPYTELPDPSIPETDKFQKMQQPYYVSWGNIDTRYAKHKLPTESVKKSLRIKVWKGERINLQALIWTKKDIQTVTLQSNDLLSGTNKISQEVIKPQFVRYVMTDELNKDKNGTCGHRPNWATFDSSLVADVLDISPELSVKANSVQPIWVNIWVPQTVANGAYKGKITIIVDQQKHDLDITIDVGKRVIPSPSQWSFHLDLWQNPYSVARYHNVPVWSAEHFNYLRPLMKMLADAGQKVITASINHKPWGGQTEDYYETMVTRVKRIDGSWYFDYTIFDKWVEMMKEVGITKQINCYSMIPWSLSFQYYDQATNRLQFVTTEVGTPEYEQYWLPFLTSFATHLKEKGWFDHTTIAMDERPMAAMQQAIKLIKKADPNYKIALAGTLHLEIESDLYDLCLDPKSIFPDEVLSRRRDQGLVSTYYTCCSESFPNTYTFSPPAEATYLGWLAAAKNVDGYLRWSYNSWTKDPLRESRFRSFGAGDCYIVYPDARSSIRFERLIEGIQDYEKLRILQEEFASTLNKKGMATLQKLLSQVKDYQQLKDKPAADILKEVKNELAKW